MVFMGYYTCQNYKFRIFEFVFLSFMFHSFSEIHVIKFLLLLHVI